MSDFEVSYSSGRVLTLDVQGERRGGTIEGYIFADVSGGTGCSGDLYSVQFYAGHTSLELQR